MNILLVAYYFPPINCAGSVRPAQMAAWLRKSGHSVTVLTHGYGKTDDPAPGIIRVPDPAFVRGHRGWKFFHWLFWRLWAELQNYCGRYASVFSPWSRAVLAQAEAIIHACRPDVILVTYPPVEVLEIGLEFARRFHVPLVSDFRDGLLFRSIEEKRMAAHRSVRERYRKTEAAIAAASTLIVAVTPSLREYFLAAYPHSRCETVFNGYDEAEWDNLPVLTLTPGYVHVVHSGRFALSDSATDVRPFLEALRRANQGSRRVPLRIHLLGEYSRRERSWMRDLVATGRIAIHPLLGRRETLAYQKAADLLLLITRPGVRSGIPLKLFEYVFSGRPVLAVTDDLEARRIVNESGAGWSISPVDTKSLAAFLASLQPGPIPAGRRQPGQTGFAAYAWECQMQKLHQLLGLPVSDQ